MIWTGWLWQRLRSLFGPYQYRPYERKVLLVLALLRAECTVAIAWPFLPSWWALVASVLLAPLAAVICADLIEHILRRWLLGYAYNPFVSAIGEWEAWMGPTRTEDARPWQDAKCGPPPTQCPWWGDPGSRSFCHD